MGGHQLWCCASFFSLNLRFQKPSHVQKKWKWGTPPKNLIGGHSRFSGCFCHYIFWFSLLSMITAIAPGFIYWRRINTCTSFSFCRCNSCLSSSCCWSHLLISRCFYPSLGAEGGLVKQKVHTRSLGMAQGALNLSQTQDHGSVLEPQSSHHSFLLASPFFHAMDTELHWQPLANRAP